jgi:hypothetical protein
VWVFLLAATALIGAANSASATTLDFESAGGNSGTCSDSVYSFPRVTQGYGGFTWSTNVPGDVNWFLECDGDYMSTLGNGYGSPSGEWAVGNDGDFTGQGGTDPVKLLSAAPFEWVGASFSSFTGLGNGSTSIEVRGFLLGAQVFTFTQALSNSSYTFGGTVAKVDQLQFFASDPNTLWLMDDFTFRELPQSAPVPEPTTMVLLGTGIVAAVVRRRRRRS